MKEKRSLWGKMFMAAAAFLAGVCLLPAGKASAASRYEFVIKNCTWSEAFKECLNKGGHLARLETEEEYLELIRQLNADSSLQNKVFFISGGRSKKDSRYYWLNDDMKLVGDVLNQGGWAQKYWFAGEPSLTDAAGNTEFVMSIFRYKGNWGLNDEPNDVLKAAPDYSGIIGYICEYEEEGSMGSTTYDAGNQYIIPKSDSVMLTDADLSGLTPQELCYARNEIYARKGRIFQSKELKEYFGQFSWYHGTMTAAEFDDNRLLNEYEKKNAKFILDYENSHGGSYVLDQAGYRIGNVNPGGGISSGSSQTSSVPQSTIQAMLGGQIIELGTSFSIDLDRNGSAEAVSLRTAKKNNTTYGYIGINGREEEINYSEFLEETLYGTSLDGKTILLLSHDFGPSDDDVTEFWRYDGSSLQWAGVIADYPGGMSISGGTIYAHTRFGLVGTLSYQSQWRYSWGTIDEVPQDWYPVFNYSEEYLFSLDSAITVYMNMTKNSSAFTMYPQKVRFTYTDGDRWVFVEGDSGQSGWFPAGDYGGSVNNFFGNLPWAD